MAFFIKIICLKKIPKLCKNLTNYFHMNNTVCQSNSNKDRVLDILFAPVQVEKTKNLRKVSIIGTSSNTGQLMAYDLLMKRYCDEIVLYDVPVYRNKLCGIALDILDGTPSVVNSPPRIKICVTGKNTVNSDLIIICSSISAKSKQTRFEIIKENADLFKTLIPNITKLSPNSILLVVTNPVDIMTYAAWKFSGFPVSRVIGTGTTLDTNRFKTLLSRKLGISQKAINAWIIGEQGKNCFPCWSTANVAGTRLKDCKECFGLKDDPECWTELESYVRGRANLIRKLKGYTNYALSMIVSELAEAILMDQRTVHPVSTACNGIHGLKANTFLSLPAVLGNQGIHQILVQQLNDQELKKLHKSAAILDKALNSYNW